MKPSLSQALYFKIINLNETPSEMWFDRVLEALYERMVNDYLPAFKKSKAYIKLLQELDLLQQGNPEDDSISLNSNESSDSNENLTTTTTQANKMDFLQVNSAKNVKHVRSLSDVTTFTNKQEKDANNVTGSGVEISKNNVSLTHNTEKNIEENLKTGNFRLTVNIIETGK